MTAAAILRIDADTSGITRAFGSLRTDARRTADTIGREFTGRLVGSYRTSARVFTDTNRAASQTVVRESQRTVMEFVRGEEQKRRAAQLSATKRIEAEKKASDIARDEARRRGLTAEQETQVRVHALRTLTRTFEAEERRRTAIVRREEKERAAARAGRVEGVVNAGRATLNAAQSAHGVIQDARRRGANAEHTLNAAFFQAGVSGTEASAMRATLQRELTGRNGRLRGLRSEDVSDALLGAQTQFSVLSGRTPEERSANLERQIGLMQFARNTYQNEGEVLRIGGLLQQQGIRGTDQMETVQTLTGIAQAGSIELSTLTREALGPLMQNVARSVNGTMTPAQRSRAVQGAVVETMAAGEIGGAAGLSPRDALNALSKTRSSLTNERTQGLLYERLHGAGRDDLANSLFERDAQGRHRLKDTNAVNFMSAMVQGFHGDANAVENLLGAGGPGRPMVLDRQQRRLIAGLASQNESGQTIAQHVQELREKGERFSAEDVERGRAMRDAEASTDLNANEERSITAVNENTGALSTLSNLIAGFQADHPFISALAGGGTGKALVDAVKGGGGGAASGEGSSLLGGLWKGASGLGTRIAGGASTLAAILRPTNAEGLTGRVGFEDDAAMIRAHTRGGGVEGAMRALDESRAQTSVSQVSASGQALREAVRDGIREGLQSANLNISPHASTVITQNARASQGQTPRAEDR